GHTVGHADLRRNRDRTAHELANRCSDLPDEAGSVVDTSAIPVAATIEQRAEEGTEQVVVPEVKFDGVDTGLHRYLCGVGPLFDHWGDLTSSDRTAVLERRGVDHPARRHGSGAGDLLGRDSPGTTQLGAHHGPLGMDGVSELTQAGHRAAVHDDLA